MRPLWMPDSPIWRLAWLHRLKGGGGQTIEVTWNNFQPPLSTQLYRPYDSNSTTLEDVSEGVVRQTWLGSGGGYRFSTRSIEQGPTVSVDHRYYLSYCLNPSIDGVRFGAEFAAVNPTGGLVAPANAWSRVSFVEQGGRNGLGIAYIGNRRAGVAPSAGDSCLLKALIYVDLTQMYGAGNEPTLEEFERQCALNGIDLTQSQPQDGGTVRPWRV